VFSSADTRDFNIEGPELIDAVLAGSYVPRSRFDATITYAGSAGTGTISAGFDADYLQAATLAAMAGTYRGQSSASGTVATMTVSATGAISGTATGGCSYTGTMLPRTSGNVWNLTVTFAGSPCDLPNVTVRGIGLLDRSTGTLIGLGLSATRVEGFLFLGQRQGAASFAAGAAPKSAPGASPRFTRTVTGEPAMVLRAR
jgi:hypothetical protein